jgi:hypothetical protein
MRRLLFFGGGSSGGRGMWHQTRPMLPVAPTPATLLLLLPPQTPPPPPSARSGKIMRRILRKIAANKLDEIGDTSTLAGALRLGCTHAPPTRAVPPPLALLPCRLTGPAPPAPPLQSPRWCNSSSPCGGGDDGAARLAGPRPAPAGPRTRRAAPAWPRVRQDVSAQGAPKPAREHWR